MVSFEDMLLAPKKLAICYEFSGEDAINFSLCTLFNSFLKSPPNKAGYCPLYSLHTNLVPPFFWIGEEHTSS